MADRGKKFIFFQDIYLRIDIFVSIGPRVIKFGKQVHLLDLTQTRLVTSLRLDYATN